MKILISAGIIFLCITDINAQKYNIKTYSYNDGLPSSQIYDVHLDDEGLVWLATANGFVKFNGYEFKTYDKRHGLRDEFIKDIFEDSRERFWISTAEGGVGLFLHDKVTYPQEFNPLDSLLVNKIIESPQTNDIWFGTNSDGIFIWNGNELRKLSVGDGIPDEIIRDIYFKDDDKVWITTENGIAVYEEGEGVIKTWNKENGLSGDAVYQAFEASDGTMWLPTDNGITLIKNDEVSTITAINGEKLNFVDTIAEEDDGTIWIGTYRNGLYWFDGEEYTHITKKNGLSSNYIFNITKDNDGTIWVATNGGGVSIFKNKEFKYYDHSVGLGASSIFSLFLEKEGTLWVGRENGISSVKDGEIQTYDIPTDVIEDEEIWNIEQLPNGNLLLLTYNYLLLEFDGENFFRSPLNDEMSGYYFVGTSANEDSVLWFVASDGIIKYKNGEYEKIKSSGGENWQWSVTTFYKDSKDNLWIGTTQGVAKYNGTDFTFFTQKDGLNGESISGIKEDGRGNIWLGTNKGISVIPNNSETGRQAAIETFENDDLFLSETMSLIIDESGGVWQGTNAGLNYYDAENWHATGSMKTMHFPLDDYGNGVEFNGNAAVIDNEGKLWFGTTGKGLFQYDKSLMSGPKATLPPHTFIRQIYANGEKVYDQELKDSAENLSLGYHENNLEIDFGAVNYKDPHRIFYRFKLEGFDEGWITTFDQRRAFYTNLDPGQYTFSVMSKSSTSDWAETASAIKFEIEGPFWQTSWFLFFGAATLIGLIIAYIKIHLNFAEKKKLKLLVDEQTKDLTKALSEKEVLIKEIHHRVKNNMAVISGLLELQSWQLEDGDAKNALEDSKLRIKTMSSIHEKLYQNKDLTGVNFKEFAEDLVHNISNSLDEFSKKVKVSMDIDVEHLDVNTAIPCALMLNELISNAYEHAFKETEAGNLHISFKERGSIFEYKVSDDGVGIPEEILNSDRSSLGLTLIESLSAQLGAKLHISGEKGTTVTLQIPK
ncbi:MAG: two-component regulator propeller domain-containing protein [Balneolaceae bacterium]